MFKIAKSGVAAIPAERRTLASSDVSAGSGTTTKKLREGKIRATSKTPEGPLESTSSNVSMRVTGSPNTLLSGNAITIDVDPMLTGMTPQTESMLHSLYRDIYYNDSVGGSAVDLMSLLPFGEFNLGGFPSVRGDTKKVSARFSETIHRLNMRTLIPEIAVDYLVLGEHCSSLLYNREKKLFTDLLPHAPEDMTIEPLPLYSQDPIITVRFPSTLRTILSRQNSPRVQQIKEHLGADIVEKIQAGSLELDPLSTLFIARKTFTASTRGVSYFRRLLPIYLIEKNLFRGTLVESARRQRGILHVTLGDGDQWIPNVQDMEFFTELFSSADSDPIGAIIATRSGVSVEEIRAGGDFWKSTDFADSVLSHKLRALSISEGFLSGEANYDSSGTALTVFLEMIRAFRDVITRKVFYDTLFPLISLINGYTIRNGAVHIDPTLMSRVNSEEALHQMNDGSKLFIPSVQWHRQLKPEGDTAYIELLNSMTEKGVPVPLRALAAAGGMDLDTLIQQQDEDIDIRKRVQGYLKKIADLKPKEPDTSESSDDQLRALASSAAFNPTRSSVMSNGRRALLNRNFDSYEPYRLSKTDKPLPVRNRKQFDERANQSIINAIKTLRKRGKI